MIGANEKGIDAAVRKITFLSLLFPVSAEQNKDTAMRAKESWVNNVNKDAFLPTELAVVEEPEDETGPAGPRYDTTCGFHGSMCFSGKCGLGVQRQDSSHRCEHR